MVPKKGKDMIEIRIQNCNNISDGIIHLSKYNLNILYAMNGTGKTTIAKAIELVSKNGDLSILKPFYGDEDASVGLSENVNNVLLYNEDFVENFVFIESEVIQNAFDVFIKTPEYLEHQQSIDDRLQEIHIDLKSNQEISILLSTGKLVLSKFTETNSGELKKNSYLKSITSPNKIYTPPEEIRKFTPLMNKDYTIDWVGWKNDGYKYDDNHICPFCTSTLETEYEDEKKIFSSFYTRSNVKNIIEMIGNFDLVKDYMDNEKKEILYKHIKETEDEDTCYQWIKHLYADLLYLVNKITKVMEFNSYSVNSEDISKLDDHLGMLKIEPAGLFIMNNLKTLEIIETINEKIETVIAEIDNLKKEIGHLKNLIGIETNKAVSDINNFLDLADINYSLEIINQAENYSKTILRYKARNNEAIQVEKIKMHLSWGERNAFALILFMHYALSQPSDLIILDDPISSFDNNKKYAIINRLFSKKKKSFYKKTVLMLTHDFQPIIDFVIINKPLGQSVHARFLRNNNGILIETDINKTDVKSLPALLAVNAKNEGLNKVHRITSLRKLIEHFENDRSNEIAYDLLSSLIHCNELPTNINGEMINFEDTMLGEELIKKYIQDFSYSRYKKEVFNRPNLVNLFKSEQNSYYLLQVFRVLIEVSGIRSNFNDDSMLKFIDEQFHVENDYIYYLDLNKFDVIPDFVIKKCKEFLSAQHII